LGQFPAVRHRALLPVGPADYHFRYLLLIGEKERLDPKQVIERVEATEAAIHGRLRDFQYDSDHHEERQLMADAQHTLAVLRRCP